MSQSSAWTTPEDLKLQVKKWWDNGELLSPLVSGECCFPRRLRIKQPTSGQITNRFAEVRQWIANLVNVPHCRIEMRECNHRVFGKNLLPSEAWIDSLDAALNMIGKRREAKQFVELSKLTTMREPDLLVWLQAHPLRALKLYEEWECLLNSISWLKANPLPNIYLRQVDIPGIHSKFIESHRGILSELLDIALPPECLDATASGVSQFARRYGFRTKPLHIRFRILDPRKLLLPLGPEQDISLDTISFSFLDPKISQVFITENEINFLSFPQLERSMVIFGAGYGLEAFGTIGWLSRCNVQYWGDIDTHGFAILSSARAVIPHIRSILMDEETLLAHSQLWSEEINQHSANELPNLTSTEQILYQRLKTQHWARNVRLEQERIGWHYAWKAIAQSLATA